MNLLYVVESGDYKYLVFDEMPDKISTKYGDDTIIGRIGGIFYDFLAKRNELSTDNVIYYSHTNTLSFNWNGYGEKITQEEFDDFVNKVDRSQLPEGIKFELK